MIIPAIAMGDFIVTLPAMDRSRFAYLATQLLISGSQPGTAPGSINHFGITSLTYHSAGFAWSPVTGASGYELARLAVPFGATQFQLYVTTGTTMAATALFPNTLCQAQLWAFNASGHSTVLSPYFTTPKKSKP